MRYHEIINELTGVKRFRDMTSTQVLDYIKQKLGAGPVEILGKGAHGAALQIGNNVYKFWMKDSAYTDFVKYCLRYPNNPFLPKFKSDIKQMPAFFRRHMAAPDFVNYVKMEKLEPISDFSYENYEFKLRIPEGATGGHGDVSVVTLGMVEAFCTNVANIDNVIQTFIETFSAYRNFNYKIDYLPESLKLFLSTMADLRRMNHYMDLHDGNVMMRGDQLVILDPIYDRDDLDLNRAFAMFEKGFVDQEQYGKPAVTSKVAQRKTQDGKPAMTSKINSGYHSTDKDYNNTNEKDEE
jgi:hypothetical protein